jgi:hypothetical protein
MQHTVDVAAESERAPVAVDELLDVVVVVVVVVAVAVAVAAVPDIAEEELGVASSLHDEAADLT